MPFLPVLGVVSLRSKVEVLKVDAGSVVAMVEDVEAVGDGTVALYPDPPMSAGLTPRLRDRCDTISAVMDGFMPDDAVFHGMYGTTTELRR